MIQNHYGILSAMPSFQPRHYHTWPRNSKMCLALGKGQVANRTNFEWAQVLDLAEKDFKTATMKMFKELKENVLKS